MPKVFSIVVYVARKLQIRYLWMDTLWSFKDKYDFPTGAVMRI